MTETAPRRITLTLPIPPAGTVIYTGSADPVAELIRQAGEELDRQRDAEARAVAAKVADIERAKLTRRSRMARRFKRAMKGMFSR
jgi:hypothetical protein